MKVYVTIELFQGLVNEVHVFQHCHSAEQAMQKWKEEQNIRDEIDR